MLQPEVACSAEQVESLIACQKKPLVLRKQAVFGVSHVFFLWLIFS
jgi:hypothetical protein